MGFSKGKTPMPRPCFLSSTEGQTLIEYAILIAVLALGMVVILSGARNPLRSSFSNIASTLSSVTMGAGS